MSKPDENPGMAKRSREHDNWLFTQNELSDTPTRRDGISALQEVTFRFQGCTQIMKAGIKLNLPQPTIATAQVYYHRFYMYKSMKKFQMWPMAACCLFLAGKVEDTPKRLNDVISCLYYLQYQNDPDKPNRIDTTSEEYYERKTLLLNNERILLQTMGFDLEVEHPYSKIIEKCRFLDAPKSVVQNAWCLINDSLRGTTLCLQFGPDLMSTAAIKLASNNSKEFQSIKDKKYKHGKVWWQVITPLHAGITLEEMDAVCKKIKAIFDGDVAKLFAKQNALDQHKKKENLEASKRGLTMEEYKNRKQSASPAVSAGGGNNNDNGGNAQQQQHTTPPRGVTTDGEAVKAGHLKRPRQDD